MAATSSSNNIDIADVGRVVGKMRLLAADSVNQPVMARDVGCLRALTTLLATASPSSTVMADALETLKHLSGHPENSSVLAGNVDLMGRLNALSSTPSTSKVELENARILADEIIANIQGGGSVEQVARPALGDITNNNNTTISSVQKKKQKPSTVFVRVENLKGDREKEQLERAIIGIRGVISVSIDRVELGKPHQMTELGTKIFHVRAVILTRIGVATIVSELKDFGYEASTVISPLSSSSSTEEAANMRSPVASRYRNDENINDSPKYLTPPELRVEHDDAVVPATKEGCSLQARLDEQKRRQERNGGWLQKVGRALWLY